MIGTADSAAELLPFVGRYKLPGDGIRRKLGKRITGRGSIGSPEPEAITVNIIAAGLGLHRDYASEGLAKFGIVVLQCHFGFLNRIRDSDLRR